MRVVLFPLVGNAFMPGESDYLCYRDLILYAARERPGEFYFYFVLPDWAEGTEQNLPNCMLVRLPMVRDFTPYTITKGAAASFMKMFAQEYGMRLTLVRETHVYGPRQAIDARQKLIPTLVGCALLGQPLPLFMQGEQRVDLVYVADVAESLIRVALQPDVLLGDEVEFATGRLVKVKHVAQMIIDLAGSESRLLLLGRRPGQTGEDDPYRDLGRIFEECGLWPLTDLESGLAWTVAWYREHLFEVGGGYLAQSFARSAMETEVRHE